MLGLSGIALVLLVPYLAETLVNGTLPRVYYGDEPHYLIMMNSLLSDGDLDLRNNYAEVHRGGLDAGLRATTYRLDHHSVWYVDGKVVRWDHLYRGYDETWDRDKDGNILPTLHDGADPEFIPTHEYSYHSPGSALFLAAFLFPLEGTAYVEPAAILCSWVLAVAGMSLFASLLKLYSIDVRRVLIVVAVVFLGTPILHYSRSLFSEIHLLMYVILAYFSFLKLNHPFLTGIALALGALVKPPLLVLAIPFGVVLIWNRKFSQIWMLCLPIASMILVQLAMNQQMFGGVMNMPQQWQWGNLVDGGMGLIFSVDHGLIPFAPIILLSFALWPAFIRAHQQHGLLILSGALIYFVIMACWRDWQGGFCYGPRLIVPIIPLLAVPLVMREWRLRTVQDWGAWVVVWISVNINLLGSVLYESSWNHHPLLTGLLF